MSRIVIRTVFNTSVVEPSWKTKATSAIVHVIVIGTTFAVALPVVNQLQSPPTEHITLLAPVLPRPHVTIPPPHIRIAPKLVAPVVPPEKPVQVIAKVLPPPVVPAPKIATAPIVPAPLPKIQPTIVADARPALPAPKPSAKVGAFEDLQAKSAPVPKQVVVGGFGDPRGVHASDSKSEPVILARVGAFDSPTGLGQSGGAGHLDAGSVRQSGFGSASTPGAPSGNGTANSVRTGNFGDSANGAAHTGGVVRATGFGDTLAATPQHKPPVATVAAFTPVEILFKPRPAYSEEARGMHIEGQVSMEVVFQANGAIKVVRIIKGLGHGLDEAAQQAASQVRFKPATRAGVPVDTSATISITFQLT